MLRRIPCESIINLRDLGGYATPGGETAFGRVFRAGVPYPPSEKDFELLHSLGIRSVIDLRGASEAADMPSAFAGRSDFDYYSMPLFEANPVMAKEIKSIGDTYLMCLRTFSEKGKDVLSLIAALDEPFLIHCFFGKDRTGILSALLLAAAGVSREDIIADYCVSEIYMKSFCEREKALNTGLIWEQNPDNFRSFPSYISGALDYIDANHGSITGFMRDSGLTEDEILRISRILD